MFPEQIIYIGIFANVVLSIWYIKSIIWGTTRPNLITWFVWSLAPLTGCFLQLKAGAGWAASGMFIGGFFPLLTVIICLLRKNSYWKISTLEIVCGVLSVIALIIYILTRNIAISMIFVILGDGIVYIPTLKKAWEFPETESASTYAGGVINNVFALLIIKNWSFSIFVFPLYIVLIDTATVAIINRKRLSQSFLKLVSNHSID